MAIKSAKLNEAVGEMGHNQYHMAAKANERHNEVSAKNWQRCISIFVSLGWPC